MTNELANTDSRFFCTVDANTRAGAVRVANALNASISLNDYANDILEVVDIVCVPGKRAKTGDDCINTHIILKDGTTLFTQSEGIAKSARFIVDILKPEFLHEGVEMMIQETPLRSGNTLKTLKIIEK